MRLSSFRFPFSCPVAKYPSHYRGLGKLMIVNRKTKRIYHRKIEDLTNFFKKGDVCVLNDSHLLHAHLKGHKRGADTPIDIFLLRELFPESLTWDSTTYPARKIRYDNMVFLGPKKELIGYIERNTESKGRIIRFKKDFSLEEFHSILVKIGKPIIPKALGRKVESIDKERLQSVFSCPRKRGSISPTAGGLHISRYTLKKLEYQGVDLPKITLHTSLNYFSNVSAEDIAKYTPCSEYSFISEDTADRVNRAKKANKRVCAIGLPVLRALEGSKTASYLLKATGNGIPWSDFFFYPPHDFFIANALLTSFFPPEGSSVSLVMQYAFAGCYDLMRNVYKKAEEEGRYESHIYGSALLII